MARRTLLLLAVVLSIVMTAVPAQAGEYEKKVQRRLNELGCSAGPADGNLGEWGRAAIIRFQAANGLNQSATLTDRTRKRLFAATQVRCDDRPVVRSGTGRRVVISQQQNYVWLVRANGSVLAQGPMVDDPDVLRSGSYRVGSKCGRPARVRNNSDYGGRLRLEYFVRFAPCGVGFHRIPVYKSSGAQIHPDWLLGTDKRQSHGCIRLSRTLAAKIWDFAGVGTKVVVR